MKKIILSTFLIILAIAGFSQTKMKDLVKEGTRFTYQLKFGGKIIDTFYYTIKRRSPELVIECSGLKERPAINYTLLQANLNNAENFCYLPTAFADTVLDNSLILFLSRQMYKSLSSGNDSTTQINIKLGEVEPLHFQFNNKGWGKSTIKIMVNGQLNSFGFIRRNELETSNSNDYLSFIDFIDEADFPVIQSFEYSPAHEEAFAAKWELIAIDN